VHSAKDERSIPHRQPKELTGSTVAVRGIADAGVANAVRRTPQTHAASHANPSGSVKGPASLPMTIRCDPMAGVLGQGAAPERCELSALGTCDGAHVSETVGRRKQVRHASWMTDGSAALTTTRVRLAPQPSQ
jgi:hypothetical protein